VQALAVQADFGFGPSISRGLSYLLAGATSMTPGTTGSGAAVNLERVGGFIASSRRVYFWVTLAATSILFLASLLIVPKIYALPEPSLMLASWILFALGVILTLSSTRLINLLIGADHVRLAQQILLGATAANLLLTGVGLKLGFGFGALALGSLANGLVQSFAGGHFFRIHLGKFHGKGDARQGAETFAQLWPTAWRSGLVSLGAYLIYNSNVFWASVNLGQPAASRYPLTLRLMQFLMVVCALPVTTQIPRISQWMATGETQQAWRFFLRRHLLGLSAMILGVLGLWLLGDRLLMMLGSKSRLIEGSFLLFMGLIYVLEFNHGYFATLVMTRNQVPFVWAATLSGLAICLGGGLLSERFGLWGLLGTVFVVQATWNNWWVPWYAWRSIRGSNHK
jgi:O-antigen/teichoic acid export membrane protein